MLTSLCTEHCMVWLQIYSWRTGSVTSMLLLFVGLSFQRLIVLDVF